MAFVLDQDEPPHLNFRTFVNALRADGDLADIHQECDPYLEVAAITRHASETRSEAPLFHNVKGAKDGLFRILGAPGCLRRPGEDEFGRIARHLALPPTSSMKEIIDYLVAGTEVEPVDPVSVPTGPCKEVKLFDIDLTALPSPTCHLSDGGKYIQTYGIHIVKSPDGKWENWAISRAMIHDKTRFVTAMIWPQHLWRIHEMWKAIGKDSPLPDGVSEPGYIGAMTGHPMKVVKCETNDLQVPANSEMVFEGTIDANALGDEGPLGEMHGYCFLGHSQKMPLLNVKAITHRKDAILPMCVSGRSGDETHTIPSPTLAANMIVALRRAEIPVLDVAVPIETMMIWTVVQVPLDAFGLQGWTSDKICREIGRVLFASKPGTYVHKILVVGDDIDIYNWDDVIWAYSTRCLPTRDEIPFEDVVTWVLLPSVAQSEGRATGADFKGAFPAEVQEKVLREWGSLGFRDRTKIAC
ncbi:hypothetical protein M409DRAFT_66771 [Zasmidium cellare ATCC 36951]|uniref:Ferulic acid decarboxylase 1 n=1 Tax=Zasmidium cellare ATCC 36951 TaxID=1080233 RepID=A0A6A6CLK9_ZASCE|nr:uncharacterized protein M409DRAFT_66771 [Zasmidium cellare ATCC 36951]KAF2166316.1 hypothetical protein M409DRAFT_66771 [Zasmidium cellare ATCC 36951]